MVMVVVEDILERLRMERWMVGGHFLDLWSISIRFSQVDIFEKRIGLDQHLDSVPPHGLGLNYKVQRRDRGRSTTTTTQ
jgi:hypothetical protein